LVTCHGTCDRFIKRGANGVHWPIYQACSKGCGTPLAASAETTLTKHHRHRPGWPSVMGGRQHHLIPSSRPRSPALTVQQLGGTSIGRATCPANQTQAAARPPPRVSHCIHAGCRSKLLAGGQQQCKRSCMARPFCFITLRPRAQGQ
jgi:hypothetical protein